MHLFHIIFSQPGKSLLEIPCTVTATLRIIATGISGDEGMILFCWSGKRDLRKLSKSKVKGESGKELKVYLIRERIL